jgi:hypothetical protein
MGQYRDSTDTQAWRANPGELPPRPGRRAMRTPTISKPESTTAANGTACTHTALIRRFAEVHGQMHEETKKGGHGATKPGNLEGPVIVDDPVSAYQAETHGQR